MLKHMPAPQCRWSALSAHQ